MIRPRRQRGVVLPIVLFFTLLLVTGVTTFVKRATLDAMLARNRDAMVSTEALARGGVELAKAILIEDLATEGTLGDAGRTDNHMERWAQAKNAVITLDDGSELRLTIEDAGTLLNINAVFAFDETGTPTDLTDAFLVAFLERMIEETPIDVQGLYDARELASNLIDYVDPDDVRRSGGFEDEYYQKQDPPYRAANGPLLSVEDLSLVEGFDTALVDVIRPYVTVYPFVGGGGINPNTAPPHVLGLIFYNDGVEHRLAKEDDVKRILELRDDDLILCATAAGENCVPTTEIFPNALTIHPKLAYSSDTFMVHAQARSGEVQRTVDAVIDRSAITDPLVLSWRVR